MATAQSNGTVFQAWFPHPLDEQLRQHAESERRSLSQTISLGVESRLQTSSRSGDEGQAPRRDSFPPPRGAGSEGNYG
jgi:hypothetical protein